VGDVCGVKVLSVGLTLCNPTDICRLKVGAVGQDAQMELDGHGLTVPQVVRFARSGGPVTCLPAALVALACDDLRVLLAGPPPTAAQRVQDPFGLRALPQVHGAGVDAVQSLERVVTTQINGAHENPLDRVLGTDIAAAVQLLPELAQIAQSAGIGRSSSA